MSGIDDRIVSMRFDNSKLASGVSAAVSTLDRLKASLNFKSSKDGIDGVQKSVGNFNFGSMTGGIDHVSAKFLALSTIGITALATITNRAVSAGLAFAKSFTFAPIQQGFQEYETKLKSIQTILANTQKDGTTLAQVSDSLGELNTYADKTIYSFSEMTKNIGLFTNAGINIKDATSNIKGFSNVAAASGTSAEGAAGAAYQLSQALSAGKVTLMDWRSLQNVGMGNANMKSGILDIAGAMGTLKKQNISATTIQKDFNGSLEKGWLTADVMSTYLKIMAGDMSAAEQKSLGLSDAQVKTFKLQQKTAEEAATKVRTFTALVGTVKEAVGSGWASTFELIVGNFDEASALFTKVNNSVSGFVSATSNARNKVIGDWKALGGRTALIEGIGNAFKALTAIIKPISAAFREIFPAKTGKDLFQLTVGFKNLMAYLIIGPETVDKLKRTFKGLFAAIDIAKQIFKGLFQVLTDVFSSMGGLGGGFLGLTAKLGDFLVRVDKALKNGTGLTTFFRNLTAVLTTPIEAVKALGQAIVGLFDGFDSKDANGAQKSLGRIGDRLKPLSDLAKRVGQAFGFIGDAITKVFHALAPLGDAIGGAFSKVSSALSEAFSSGNFNGVLDAINTGLLGGITLLIAKWMKGGVSVDVGGGVFGSIKDSFEGLTGTLKTMQTNVKADTLLKIAAAVALLTVSIVALSLIDSDKLTKALAAIAVGFGQLLAAMAILSKIGGAAGFAKIPAIAGAMILLATAILILTAAVKNLSDLNWEELLKGLVGVGVLLGLVSLAAKALAGNSKGLIVAGAGMILIASAIRILVFAVKEFATMKWADLAKGLGGVAGALLIIAAAMRAMPPSMLANAAAIAILAGALQLLALAIEKFATIPWQVMGKGLLGIAAALVAIGLAMRAMPKSMIAQAAALILVGVALQLIAKAIKNFGDMSWEELAKGMTALALSLGILAAGLTLMSGSIGGAAALVVAALALAILVPVLAVLGALPIPVIVQGLIALAATFAVLGLAGLILAPLVPVILGLSLALLGVALAMALAGGAALAIATAFQILAAVGSAGVKIVLEALKGIVDMIPYTLTKLGEGLTAFIKVIGDNSPVIIAVFVKILLGLLDAVIKVTPKIGTAVGVIITTILGVLVKAIPQMVVAGLNIITGILRGLSDNIGKVITAGADLIISFLDGLGSKAVDIINAAALILLNFLTGLATAIRTYEPQIIEAAADVGIAIIEGIIKGIGNIAYKIGEKLKGIASDALSSVAGFIGIGGPAKAFMPIGSGMSLGMAVGVDKKASVVTDSVIRVADDAKAALVASLRTIPDILTDMDDFNPTITPILDLTQARKDASAINGLVATDKLLAGVSANQAKAIVTDTTQDNDNNAKAKSVGDVVPVSYTQNNYSPKALSAIDIFRQTKNQLSTAKGALPV